MANPSVHPVHSTEPSTFLGDLRKLGKFTKKHWEQYPFYVCGGIAAVVLTGLVLSFVGACLSSIGGVSAGKLNSWATACWETLLWCLLFLVLPSLVPVGIGTYIRWRRSRPRQPKEETP